MLQNSVGLQLFPGHIEADVFSSEAYQAFAQVAAASEAGKEPEDLQIMKVLPILHDRMSMLREDVKQTVRQEVKAVFAEISELEAAVQSFTVRADSDSPPGTSSQAESGHSLRSNGMIIKVSDLWQEWSVGLGSGFETPDPAAFDPGCRWRIGMKANFIAIVPDYQGHPAPCGRESLFDVGSGRPAGNVEV